MRIRIKYFTDKIEKLDYIAGKSDWIDLRAAEEVELKKGEFALIPLDNDQWFFPAYALRDTAIHTGDRICQFRIMEHQPAIEFEEAPELGHEDRGGHGSTGRS